MYKKESTCTVPVLLNLHKGFLIVFDDPIMTHTAHVHKINIVYKFGSFLVNSNYSADVNFQVVPILTNIKK